MSVHALTPRKVRMTEHQRATLRREAQVRGVTTIEIIDEAIRDLAASIERDASLHLPDHATPRASVRVSPDGWRLLQELPNVSDDRAVIRASATDLLSAAIEALTRRINTGQLSDEASSVYLSA